MHWIIEEKYKDMLVREYLLNVRAFSRTILKAIKFDGGSILVNEQQTDVRYKLKTGDRLKVSFPAESKGEYMWPEPIPLKIVFEDDDILIVDKQPGIATIPSFNHKGGTLANGILNHYQKNKIPYTVHVVTRLDRDTSGLLLVAKHRYSHSLIWKKQKNERAVKRKYLAAVHGHLESKEGTINAPIGRHPESIIQRMVTPEGKEAITHYQVLHEIEDYSLIKVELETGRTHQIRVHFSHLGHPLLGDTLYGGTTKYCHRQALHCCELLINHPTLGEEMIFSTEWPEDLNHLFPQKKG